jgi:hypothetical protein
VSTVLFQAVKTAVAERDARRCQGLADLLRWRHGMNYERIYDFVNKNAPIELPEWDALMSERTTPE